MSKRDADLLLLCAAEQIKGDSLLPRRHPSRLHQISVLGHAVGSVWLLEPLWVRLTLE